MPPHGPQVPSKQRVRGAVQVTPAQHAWPFPPHESSPCLHEPPWQVPAIAPQAVPAAAQRPAMQQPSSWQALSAQQGLFGAPHAALIVARASGPGGLPSVPSAPSLLGCVPSGTLARGFLVVQPMAATAARSTNQGSTDTTALRGRRTLSRGDAAFMSIIAANNGPGALLAWALGADRLDRLQAVAIFGGPGSDPEREGKVRALTVERSGSDCRAAATKI